MELLERETALRELTMAWKDVTAGKGRVALVNGEAGIGKTSLVEQFTRDRRDSARVLWGACDSLFTPRPLGPLHDIAAQLQGSLLAQLNSDSNRPTLFSAVLVELQKGPAIVVIEDLHWADEATLDLIKFLGRRIARTSALLVMTYRDDELGPKHPLRIVLGDIATSPAVGRIPLSPLSEPAVRALVGERPMDSTALHRQTGGNPFFLTEVLANEASGIPPTVRDAVLARAARLSASGRAVLEAAAVVGPRIEPWVLTEITGAEAKSAEECLAIGVLIAQGDLLAFRHELARQTIVDSIMPHQRRVLHRLVLEALKLSATTRNDLARLAHHAQAAGDREAVLEYAAAAARRAAAAAHREATALYALALRYADDVPLNERGCWLEEYAGEMDNIGALEDGATIRRQAVETWRAVGNRHREGLNLARLAVTQLNIGQPLEARQTSQEALDLLQELPPRPELALAQRTRAHLLMLNRDCAEAIAWGNQAIELAQRFNDRETLARAYTTVGSALLLIDDERGRDHLEKCIMIAQEIGWEFGVANAYANLGSISCEVFRLHNAAAYLRDGLAYTGDRDLDFLGKYML